MGKVKWLKAVPEEDTDMESDKTKAERKARVDKVRAWLDDLDDYLDELTFKQEEFLIESKERIKKYGDNTSFTDRQYGWIKGLWEKNCDGNFAREDEDIWD